MPDLPPTPHQSWGQVNVPPSCLGLGQWACCHFRTGLGFSTAPWPHPRASAGPRCSPGAPRLGSGGGQGLRDPGPGQPFLHSTWNLVPRSHRVGCPEIRLGLSQRCCVPAADGARAHEGAEGAALGLRVLGAYQGRAVSGGQPGSGHGPWRSGQWWGREAPAELAAGHCPGAGGRGRVTLS